MVHLCNGLDGRLPSAAVTTPRSEFDRATAVSPRDGHAVHDMLVEGNLVDEECEVWDARGRLVAQATQLAAVRTPR